MINTIKYENISIQEFERNWAHQASGKILTIKVELETGISLSVISSLGEEIISVKESGIYYPRQNISTRRDSDNPLTGEVQESDYFYVTDELLIELRSDTEMAGKIGLKELIILYDDLE